MSTLIVQANSGSHSKLVGRLIKSSKGIQNAVAIRSSCANIIIDEFLKNSELTMDPMIFAAALDSNFDKQNGEPVEYSLIFNNIDLGIC